jgi:hypothetical protein
VRSRFGIALALVVLASLLAAVGFASAPDKAATVSEIVKELRRYPAHGSLAREPIAHAERALRRARDARAAGDHEHAAMLEHVAEEWALTGRDLVRAAQAESEASRLQKQAAEVETKLVRARALVEETVARRGRAREKLEELEQDAGAPGAAAGAAAPGVKK